MPHSNRGPQQAPTATPHHKSPRFRVVTALRIVGTTVLLASVLAACGVLSPSKTPVASFTMTPTSGEAPLTIDVDASASSDADGSITSYEWAVTGPTSATATGKTAQFTLSSVGAYTVKLTVTDDSGLRGSQSKLITVDPSSTAKAPVASFTMTPTSGEVPLTIDVDASASSDADGVIAKYDWSVTGPSNAADTGKTAQFTLSSVGDYTVTLTVTDDGGLSDSQSKMITVDPSTASTKFNIELMFADPSAFSAAERAAFVDAAARWSEVITGNLTEFNLPAMPANYCGAGGEAVSARTVDDLLIQVMLRTLDGPGGLLAFAGPCRLRTSGPDNGLPGYGIMVFDEADAAMLATAGTLTATVMHEMGHVLGIGTLWQQNGLLAWEPNGDPCESAVFTQPPTFLGANGKAGYVAAGGAGDVPVEDDGGAGTRCGHWDEGYFDNELMTGWIEGAGTPMPISQVTVGSLDDLGYTVSLAAADAFTMPGCAPGCAALKTQGEGGPINEILIYPVPEDLP